jgi:hypothetical protein
MTRKEFEALPIGSWFHSKKFNQDYQIEDTKEYCHVVMVFDLQKNRQIPDFWMFESCENYDFEIGRFRYIPKHNELCTILTKNGLGTKAIAIHYNGKVSAISIDKQGNTDYHFKAEQIEKFFPLPPE